LDLDSSKPLIILDSTISPYLMKTNPWLLVLDLFESEAVPAKQSLSNIQHLWQQVRKVHIACVLLNQYNKENQPKSISSSNRNNNHFNK